jgi:hypothetical protein
MAVLPLAVQTSPVEAVKVDTPGVPALASKSTEGVTVGSVEAITAALAILPEKLIEVASPSCVHRISL